MNEDVLFTNSIIRLFVGIFYDVDSLSSYGIAIEATDIFGKKGIA